MIQEARRFGPPLFALGVRRAGSFGLSSWPKDCGTDASAARPLRCPDLLVPRPRNWPP